MSKDRGGEGRIETRGNRAFVTISVGLLRKRGGGGGDREE